jgi:two-component system LytT family response regulator
MAEDSRLRFDAIENGMNSATIVMKNAARQTKVIYTACVGSLLRAWSLAGSRRTFGVATQKDAAKAASESCAANLDALRYPLCRVSRPPCRKVRSPTILSRTLRVRMTSEYLVKVLIVDDQPHGRENLFWLCECRDDLQVVGAAACGKSAIDAAGTLNPDIMFLDVELPDMSGFDLLRAAAPGPRPLGIMVSNCADHATRAFEEGAFDYLVMPVAAERFDRAINRARYRLEHAEAGSGRFSADSSETARTVPVRPRFLVGERQRKLYPLEPKSIDYIEADGNYVTLRVGKVEYLSRDSIKQLSTQLAELGFVRITRSLLVNVAAVLYAERAGHGIFSLTLTSGVCLRTSAAYRESILRILPLPALSKRVGAAS